MTLAPKQASTRAWVANSLTVSRIFFAALFMVTFCPQDFGIKLDARWQLIAAVLALIIFVLALLTDFIDGKVARYLEVVSVFGQLMDPIADKVLVAAGLIAFVSHSDTPFVRAWMVVVIIAREFLVTGLRLIAAAQGKVLSAERMGKHKAGWQMGYITVVLGMVVMKRAVALQSMASPILSIAWMCLDAMAGIGIYVVILVTWIAGGHYLWKNWRLIAGEAD